jgi:hypothetical protein
MKALLLVLAASLLLVAPAAGAPAGKRVEVYVAVPADAVTTITVDEAVQTIQRITGQPTDAPCLVRWSPYDSSTWTCSMEGWFRHELGQVFDYRITVVPIPALGFVGRDACGSYAGFGAWQWTMKYLADAHVGFSTAKGARSFVYLIGGGGWAGHFAPTNTQVEHAGMVGDWGAMVLFDKLNGCIPPEYREPQGGFSHELVGSMGMYVNGGCYDDGLGCYSGDAMTAVEKAALLKYSGQWLYAAA